MSSVTLFNIDVLRRGSDGQLSFSHGGLNIAATCWWDPDVVIDAGTYTAYATRMTNKTDGADGGKREGIWLGRGVPYTGGNGGRGTSNGIFIHKGVNASWSDGCIVLPETYVVQIWNVIQPKERPVVRVTVRDETLQRSRGCRLTQ
jgi:hypothetical protein